MNRRSSNRRLSILVTGASTGIGRALVEKFASDGHQVFASVRKPEDGDSLNALAGEIIPLFFDVTDTEAVFRCAKEAEHKRYRDRAFCIVNNAGIAVGGPLEILDLKDFKRQFEVNVFGVFAVTQAFLPLVRAMEGGRIVNMSSVSGKFASPFLGAYSSSKYALEAYSDALRRELAVDDIKVLIIEPGPVATPIWDKGLKMPRPEGAKRYEQALDRFERYVDHIVKRALEPKHVVRAVERALLENDPPLRQIVTSIASRAEYQLMNLLPDKWIDKALVQQLFKPTKAEAAQRTAQS